MADNSSGMVVTEEMIITAADVGDLESLRIWARQGMRVKTSKPLWMAVAGEYPEVLEVLKILVQELGADVNQAVHAGSPPLIMAAADGDLAMVRCLVELGASIDATDNFGDTTLLKSVRYDHISTMQYLLEHAGANMDDISIKGDTIWDLQAHHFDERRAIQPCGACRLPPGRGSAPPLALVARLAPDSARVVQEGARLRARLPVYLEQRRALLDAHCAVLLPPLRALVHSYMELITNEELWATGLGTDL
jgi:hypothetical protein